MVKSLLKIGTILPPLLDRQISPPYRIVARHLKYLQQWRKYLLGIWSEDSNKCVEKTHIQKAVDDLISTILLIDFVKQKETTAIPSLEELLKKINKLTAHQLCGAVRNQIPCRLLKHIFYFDSFSNTNIEPHNKFTWSSLIHISEASEVFYGSQMPITIFGDFHQLCIDHPAADRKIREKDSQRYFLLGILNSSIFKVWGQNRMPNLGSGWHSYRVNIMRNFPVPTWQSGKNRNLCSRIADLTRQLLSEGSDKDERLNIISSIDNKVIELYDVLDVLPS